MTQNIKYLLILTVVFFVACSSEEKLNKEKSKIETDNEVNYQTGLDVKFHKVYSWVNLMPGPKAQPRFHITGEYEVFESPNYDFNQVKLGVINILQSDSLIYNINPDIRYNEKLSTDSSSYGIFSNPTPLSPHPALDREKPIDAKFIFYSATDTLMHYINDITIEEAH